MDEMYGKEILEDLLKNYPAVIFAMLVDKDGRIKWHNEKIKWSSVTPQDVFINCGKPVVNMESPIMLATVIMESAKSMSSAFRLGQKPLYDTITINNEELIVMLAELPYFNDFVAIAVKKDGTDQSDIVEKIKEAISQIIRYRKIQSDNSVN